MTEGWRVGCCHCKGPIDLEEHRAPSSVPLAEDGWVTWALCCSAECAAAHTLQQED